MGPLSFPFKLFSRSAPSRRTNAIWLFRVITAALLLGVAVQPTVAQAQEEAAPETAAEEEAAPEEKRLLDLGTIRLKEFRPEKNESLKLSFVVHFMLSSSATEEDLAALETWRHRLRDQVIVAVRTAETNDFREPGLLRLRRIIHFRIEQIVKTPLIESLLLSDYSFNIE